MIDGVSRMFHCTINNHLSLIHSSIHSFIQPSIHPSINQSTVHPFMFQVSWCKCMANSSLTSLNSLAVTRTYLSKGNIVGTLGCVFIDNETHESGVTKCTTGEAWSAFSWHHSSVFHCQWTHNQVFLLLSHMLIQNAKSIFIYVMKYVSGFIWKMGINFVVCIKWIDETWWNNRLLLVPNCYEVVAMVAPLWCHTLR